MIVMQEVGQRQIHPAVLGKRSRPSHQSGCIAIRRADIVQYVLGSFLLQLDIAALRDRHEAVLDFAAHAVRGVRQQRCKFILKIVLSVSLTDEIQYGQAFLLFAQTQATAQLLQKIVNDSVGRRKRTVLTSGISTPSL